MNELHACDNEYTTEILFNSITTEYDLYCNQGHVKEFMQAVTLFVSSIISSIILAFQNKFGSKNIMLLTFLFSALPGFVCMVFVDNLKAKAVGIIGLWIYHDVTFALTSVYFNELLVEPFRNISNAISRIAHSLGAIFGTLMTLYLTDYKLIVSLYFSGYVIFNVLLLFALTSSPSYLLKQNKMKDLTKAIIKIASVNRYPLNKLDDTLDNLDIIVASKENVRFNFKTKCDSKNI